MIKHTVGKPSQQGSFIVLKPGDYSFKVLDAVEKVSKNNNQMIELKLQVGDEPETTIVYDYLVFDGKSEWKFDNFLKCTGTYPGEGEAMNVEARHLVGEAGECSVKIETYEGKDRNKIAAYLFEEDGDGQPF